MPFSKVSSSSCPLLQLGRRWSCTKAIFFKILRKQAPQNNEERMGNLNPREQFIYRGAENQETNITQV